MSGYLVAVFPIVGQPFLAQANLSVCKFSLRYPHKISCLVMRIKQMIIHRKLSKMKNKILPTCLQGNYGDSLGEFSNTLYGVVRADRVNRIEDNLFSNYNHLPSVPQV